MLFKQVAISARWWFHRAAGPCRSRDGQTHRKAACRARPLLSPDQTTEPLLQEVNAQHSLDGKARAAAFGASARRREWLDQTHQFCPRDDKTHLIEKHSLARALSDKLESAAGKTDFFSSSFNGFQVGIVVRVLLSFSWSIQLTISRFALHQTLSLLFNFEIEFLCCRDVTAVVCAFVLHHGGFDCCMENARP